MSKGWRPRRRGPWNAWPPWTRVREARERGALRAPAGRGDTLPLTLSPRIRQRHAKRLPAVGSLVMRRLLRAVLLLVGLVPATLHAAPAPHVRVDRRAVEFHRLAAPADGVTRHP